MRRFQLGMRSYEDLVANVRGFSQEAWFSSKGPNDMDLDTADYQKGDETKGWEAVQKWVQTAFWDEMNVYWEQQHQQDLDYMGRPKGGRKGGTKGNWVEGRKCHWCDEVGHLVRFCTNSG